MEDKANLIKRGREGGGCPTRLQKHAPASLEIDKVLNGRPADPFAEASKAIPLLSPLILSPQPQPLYVETTIQARTSENNDNNSTSNEGSRSSTSTPGTGWEHPAMAPFPAEPSSLCSFFQQQCVFVNHAQ